MKKKRTSTSMSDHNDMPDVCLILEGTYPYVAGGVSGWTHELIKMHSHLKFTLLSLVPKDAPIKQLYELPSNVVKLQTVRLQQFPQNGRLTSTEEATLFAQLEPSLFKLQSRTDLDTLRDVIKSLAPFRGRLSRKHLLDSPEMWGMFLRIYHSTMPKTAFLDYFWSWRGLFGGLLSVLLTDLPKAKTYHALCTGYAGLLLARAHIETGRPCIVTEHGIYTNERRIEIASADWIEDSQGMNLTVADLNGERDLKDLWIDTFGNYSRFCYEAADEIITLYKGNQEFQKLDGAPVEKLKVIPNGIDFSLYENLSRKDHPPTVALIGRVVPIKDVKTYIKAVHILKQSIPNVRALVLGPADEDPAYARECRALAEHLKLGDTLTFTGKVDVREYLPQIDVNVLTSLSEAQPLVVLETGAAGIPSVATDVGACREMILGKDDETHSDIIGGAIVSLGSPREVATEMKRLLTDASHYASCSSVIKERVRLFYSKEDQRKSYADLYHKHMTDPDALLSADDETREQSKAA